MLTNYGITVIGSAKDGEEAIKMFKSFKKKPDFIIMDHRMPLKDGIQTMKEILQIDKTSKIIFASADRSIEEVALTKGAIAFLLKPFRIKMLINLIKKKSFL